MSSDMSDDLSAAPLGLALVGVGKIARDQHLPAIYSDPAFELRATASRNASVEGVEAFRDLESLLAARADIACVALCNPPQVRFDAACMAIAAGRHVLLEKPPGATLSEVHALVAMAEARGVTLFATWHSRFAHCVPAAKSWLAGKTIRKLEIIWKEDVRRWHPGQDWIWRPGGFGVFDPGVNALSILTEIFPRPLRLTKAELSFPSNRDTPIAADLTFHDRGGADVTAAFDFRQEGPQTWDIRVTADEGTMVLSMGGAVMTVDGAEAASGPEREYRGIYQAFAQLIARGASEIDLAPMVHVADAFTLGRRAVVAPFDF
ncbi:MAG: D-galactose 1-dehydrogenase [Paracoccaceae bacterium]|jgi:D-galactose 1-dehydrogenase